MGEEKANLIAYVKSGKNRLKVLQIMEKHEKLVFASDIADEIGIRVNHMGALLRELTEKGLLNNLTPQIEGKNYMKSVKKEKKL